MKTVTIKGNSGVSTTLQLNNLFPYQSVISASTVLIARKIFLIVVSMGLQDLY